jgi:hypothetical protein
MIDLWRFEVRVQVVRGVSFKLLTVKRTEWLHSVPTASSLAVDLIILSGLLLSEHKISSASERAALGSSFAGLALLSAAPLRF